MGDGKGYTCKKCGNNYEVCLGVGMLFPTVFQELIDDIKTGKLGDEWKALVESEGLVVPDAANYLFYCENCGFWEAAADASLYVPNDVEAIKKEQYGIKTVEEWGYIPYAASAQLQKDYHLLRKRDHRCPKCQKKLKRISSTADSKIINNLPCPECGTKNEPTGYIMWD